jgi:hypothetical protein
MLFMFKNFIFFFIIIENFKASIINNEILIFSFIGNTNIKIIIFLIKIFKLNFIFFLKELKKILKKIYVIKIFPIK